MATTKTVCFAVYPNALERWKRLRKWWESEAETGLKLGEPIYPPLHNMVFPPSVAESYWEGQDEAVSLVFDCPALQNTWRTQTDLWLRKCAGQDTINTLAEAHDNLVNQAKYALAAEKGKHWGWRSMVPLQAVQAARILAELPNPYPISPGPKRSPIKEDHTSARREIVKALRGLCKAGSKRRITDPQLAVLYMLAAPQFVGADVRRPDHWWEDGDYWNPGNTSVNCFLQSKAFKRHLNTIKSDIREIKLSK
ncbi:MAG TPA: hypothetical protein PLY68_08350 [Myxococcota bacterium]|nr:hypothetical protein [Myxococcota bacterium]HQP96185.1 hypothetical protein [Myxococcota bacterium]